MNYLEDISIDKLKNMTVSEMESLAEEIRLFLIEKVTKTGGHLASNLGIVELTLAVHYVFDSPKDKILFDVGHQSYTHKILTGRKDGFDSLRQYGGISGFPRPNESPHDVFSMGHASNSISVAAGLAKIRDIAKEDYSVVSVIGDGALSGGMAMEAINDAGYSKNKIIVILNDNEMSIAKNVGAMAGFLGKMRTTRPYTKIKSGVINFILRIPGIGEYLKASISRMKKRIKYMILPNQFFEEMGFTYIGILDGHDIDSLIDSLND
ncbi:MAG: 1-deoxy-D-xylulose-5-phosphate synthase, partial [Clostridia bacterium]|nr:1-deoxy-D-xylulose-5-phosphate synthase [Clostridia bacterium]